MTKKWPRPFKGLALTFRRQKPNGWALLFPAFFIHFSKKQKTLLKIATESFIG
jgi:hypothetical protein